MSDKNKPVLSIVIVNWNTRDLLAKCLQSIYDNVAVPFEIIVVDNASTDGSPEMVASEFPSVLLLRNERNIGFSAASNLGIRQGSGEFVMLLNSDAELCPGTAERMIEFLRSNPQVGLVAPKLVGPDGVLQINGQKFPTFLREVLGVLRVSRIIPGVARLGWGREDFDRNAEVDALAGACMLVRRPVIDSVGLLDERFFMYFEDVDWCRRIKKAGWKIYYLGEAQIVHSWAQSSLKQGLVKSHSLLHKSRYLYFRKHHGLLQALPLWIVSALVHLAFCVKYRGHAGAGGVA